MIMDSYQAKAIGRGEVYAAEYEGSPGRLQTGAGC